DDPDSEIDLQRSSKFPKLVLGAGIEICNLNSAFISAEGENIVKFGDAVTIDMQRPPHTPRCLLCF
ncbi:Hypothetical predicted protein, partial [Paramuricea clavata]